MFVSAEGALGWAYTTISRPIVKMSAINYMRQNPPKGAVNFLLLELDSYAQHAQAAQIIAMVERLSHPEKLSYIKAKFGRELSRDNLRSVVYWGLTAVGFGLDKTDVVYRIVRGYFDGSMNHRDIRKALGCRDQYAVMVRSCLYETLDRIHDQAMADITEVFREHGLIRSASSYA